MKRIWAKLEVAPDEKIKARNAICEECPKRERVFRTNMYRCTACGCPLVTKTKLDGASCPDGKW